MTQNAQFNPGAGAAAVNAANAAAAAKIDAELDAMLGIGTFLTAEEMFAFAKQQLEQTDAQIHEQVKDISIRKEQAAVLQAISGGLRSVKNATNAEQKAKVEELIAQAEQAGLTDVANKLITTKGNIENLDGEKATSDGLEGLAQEVDAAMNSLTSSAELTMLKIQGLMQQRSQILQLASNVIAALNEPVKNAIGNIRGS